LGCISSADYCFLDFVQVVDLEALQFEGGGHFLASKSVHLPQETFKRTGKGYEEARFSDPSVKSLSADVHVRRALVAAGTVGEADAFAALHLSLWMCVANLAVAINKPKVY
jgi:hypothetical protein